MWKERKVNGMDTGMGMGKEKENIEKNGKKKAHGIFITLLYLKQKS